MSQNSRRLFLRESTSTAHARLDATVGPLETLEAYRTYLAGQYGFRQPLEAQLRGVTWPGGLEPAAGFWIADLLHADMIDLGMEIPPDTTSSDPAPRDLEDLLGVLYVIEGSSFGARVLLRQAQALGLSSTHGARHLARQAESTDGWRNFLAALEAAPMADGMDRCVSASVATFARAERAFGGAANVPA